MFCEEAVDRGGELGGIEIFREVVDGTFAIVFDSDVVEEFDEHFRMAAREPDLENALRRFVAELELKSFVSPLHLLLEGLFLNEDGAEFFLGGQGSDRGLVERLILFANGRENLRV